MMTGMLLLLMGIFFSMAVCQMGLEVSDAKQYHMWVMERLEMAKYASSVKQGCQKEAEEQGYQLAFQEETRKGRKVEKVTLYYKVHLPFAKDMRGYQIEGFSYLEGR